MIQQQRENLKMTTDGKIEILLGIASKDENVKITQQNIIDYNKSQQKVEISNAYWLDNKTSLPKLYNILIEDANKMNYDFLIFMHADVKLDFAHFIDHLLECKDKYDVFGLCGCTKFSVGRSPLNWFTGSQPFPDQRWGCVTHGELGDQTSFFSEDRKDITDAEVACIDGLCIVLSRKAIDSGIRFDEQFLFDQYDTDFSAQCLMKYKLKLGVLVEPSLQHYSVGKSILTQEFLVHEQDLRKKWNWQIVAPPQKK